MKILETLFEWRGGQAGHAVILLGTSTYSQTIMELDCPSNTASNTKDLLYDIDPLTVCYLVVQFSTLIKQMTIALSRAMAEMERDEMMMKIAWSGDWRWHRRVVSPQCHLWYTTSTLGNRSYLFKARTLMLLKEYKEAHEIILEETNWPKNLLALILLPITAKLMQLPPYKDAFLLYLTELWTHLHCCMLYGLGARECRLGLVR